MIKSSTRLLTNRVIVVLAMFAGLTACEHKAPQHPTYSDTSSAKATGIANELFGPRIDVPTKKQIFLLSPEQRTGFLTYFESPNLVTVEPNKRIFNYLSELMDGFHFRGDTLDAQNALAFGNGNCMSLAVLTGALSELVGVNASYQLIDSIPVYDRDGNIDFRSNHIRSRLSVSNQSKLESVISFRRSYVNVDYFPSVGAKVSKTLSDDEFIAAYYRNRAGELLAQNNHQASYWWLNAARALDPQHPELYNMLAIAYRRAGDIVTAEQYFTHGISLSSNHLSLLKNYHRLLVDQQRLIEAKSIKSKIRKLNDSSPFHFLNTAYEAMDDKDFRRAEFLFSKVIDIAPYMHQAHLGLAQTHYYMGNSNGAISAMHKAISNTTDEMKKDVYQAKLMALKKLNAE